MLRSGDIRYMPLPGSVAADTEVLLKSRVASAGVKRIKVLPGTLPTIAETQSELSLRALTYAKAPRIRRSSPRLVR